MLGIHVNHIVFFSSLSFCMKIKLKDVPILNANTPPFYTTSCGPTLYHLVGYVTPQFIDCPTGQFNASTAKKKVCARKYLGRENMQLQFEDVQSGRLININKPSC